MKCLTEHHDDLKELKHMCSSDNHEASFEAAPKFIVLLYGAKQDTLLVLNHLRIKMAVENNASFK